MCIYVFRSYHIDIHNNGNSIKRSQSCGYLHVCIDQNMRWNVKLPTDLLPGVVLITLKTESNNTSNTLSINKIFILVSTSVITLK